MVRRQRLDAELVRRGLARSRQHAGELVASGRVAVGGRTADKPASQVQLDAAIAVAADRDGQQWVSRGAHKLIGALDAFPWVRPAGRRCLDVGASTGGFTHVLLERGAAHVVCVDVGYGQLAWSLRQDVRVTVLDRTNVRQLSPEQVAPAPTLVVADLSFISLRLALPALAACAAAGAEWLLMVKPQFEVGRQRLGSGGVVRDPGLRADAVLGVARAAAELGLWTRGVVASPLPGPSGNVEYFVWLRRGPDVAPVDDEHRRVAALVEAAVAEGPSGAVTPSGAGG